MLLFISNAEQHWSQVAAGLECGVGVADFAGWKEGDRLEVFSVEQKQRTLEEASAAG